MKHAFATVGLLAILALAFAPSITPGKAIIGTIGAVLTVALTLREAPEKAS